jgi:hypothetical protein
MRDNLQHIIYIFTVFKCNNNCNCSAIVDADTPEDGNIKPKHVVWKCQNTGREIVAFKDCMSHSHSLDTDSVIN